MRLQAITFTHGRSTIPAREALARLGQADALAALREAGWTEAVVLSTCNRFEVYIWPAESRAPAESVLAVLERCAGAGLSGDARVLAGEAAIQHLFSVAAGLESIVIGETEILGQVKNAYEAALSAGMTGKRLNVLFQRALYVGKRVRRDTAIAEGQTSAASVAVQLAAAIFGDLAQSAVLVLGAGQMAEQACRHFVGRGIRELAIINRTRQRAELLAAALRQTRMTAQVHPWEDLAAALTRADVVLSSTGAGHPVITAALVQDALRRRGGKSLFMIDIAMPRDIEESVHEIDGVYVYRLEDLERIVARNLSSREGEIGKARAFVAGKAVQLQAWAESVSSGSERSLTHSS
jgi:glutamyl-tRNA reductase